MAILSGTYALWGGLRATTLQSFGMPFNAQIEQGWLEEFSLRLVIPLYLNVLLLYYITSNSRDTYL